MIVYICVYTLIYGFTLKQNASLANCYIFALVIQSKYFICIYYHIIISISTIMHCHL